MRRYLVRRLLNMIPLMLGITLITFTIYHLAPGDPGLYVTGELGGDPTAVARLRQQWGLDDPIPVQYVKWLSRLLQGDFGKSMVEGRPVLDMVLERLPNTLLLNAVVIFFSYLLAIPIGIISARHQYSWFDYGVTMLAFFGEAMPGFWLGLMLIYFIGMKSNKVIPISGMATYGVTVAKVGVFAFLLDRIRYLILPVTAALVASLAGLARYMRSSMLEVIREDYVRTARAKGVSERVVIYRHAFRNALLPIVTLSGNILPGLFAGSIILETIFSWPGLGLVAYRAIQARDYPVVMAFNTISGLLAALAYLVVEMVYVAVDPRIRYS